MLESINVRFFCYENTNGGELNLLEISYDEFVDLQSVAPSARIDHELHSVFSNGVRQLCLTLNIERESGEVIP